MDAVIDKAIPPYEKPAFFIIASAMLLCMGALIGNELFSQKVPDVLEIETSEGKSFYAEIERKNLKFINVEGGQNPGSYLALPLYEDRMEYR